MDKIGFKGVYQPPLPPPPSNTWDITAQVVYPRQIFIGLSLPESVTISWGDGFTQTYTTEGNKSHTYATNGTYVIRISGSVFSGGNIRFGFLTGSQQIIATSKIRGVTGFTTNAFYRTFAQTSITSVPDDLFAEFPGLSSGAFVETFRGSDLNAIPATLFQSQTGITTGSFLDTFNYCFGLTGDAPALWNSYPDPSNGAGCFLGCHSLNNYAGIPAAWK